MRSYLANAVSVYLPAGYSLSHGPFFGSTNAGATNSFELQLIGGYRYIFIGQCDSDCSDMDMAITDAYGNVVAGDTLSDDDPVVSVDAMGDTNVFVTVRIYSCTTDWCAWGIAIGSNYGGPIS